MKFFNRALRIEDIDQPPWKDSVERWYQLDQTSMILCQAMYEWQQNETDLTKTSAIIYFFEKGSDLADREFVQGILTGQAASPAKFVYTLPNIPMMVVQQMLKISVPVFCFDQNARLAIKELTTAMLPKFNQLLVVGLKTPQNDKSDSFWTVQGILLNKENNLTTIDHIEF